MGQQSDLHFRRTGIGIMGFQPINYLFFVFCCVSHFEFILLVIIDGLVKSRKTPFYERFKYPAFY